MHIGMLLKQFFAKFHTEEKIPFMPVESIVAEWLYTNTVKG
jgi:hypothetical protein